MKDIIKKSFLLGLGAASMTMTQADRIVKQLVKSNSVSVKEGKQLLGRVRKHAASESKRISKFAQQEGSRMAKEFRLVSKVQVANVRKKLKSVDQELSAQGKKTLRKILKELSR